MNRQEHLEWCKQRARQYLDHGDLRGAYMSMLSDLNKHPDTQDHPAGGLGLMLMQGGQLSTAEAMRDFIEGFN